jgi:EpsD family peptidyl-prolyl cis-trans isomerase
MRLRPIPRLPRPRSPVVPLGALLFVAGLAAGCGGGQDRLESQTAAKVNKEELTVHQINGVLAQQRGLRPEDRDEASRRVLERLIDQELAVQKAAELKVDREPRVVQAIESARRDIIARAYAERVGEGATRPTAAEVKRYYDENPALFRERRVYQLQEFAVQMAPQQSASLRERLQGSRTVADVAQRLKAAGLAFASNQVVRAAEQVPLDRLGDLSKLQDGQLLVSPSPSGASVLLLLASRTQPIDEARARPAIEQFLLNDRKRRLVSQDLQSLRSAAKIEYVGKFAGTPPPGPAASGPTVAEAAASAAAGLPTDGIVAAPRAAASAAEVGGKASSGVDASVQKGLGLK